MARYPLNLPTQLKQDAEKWAAEQGVSLNQFIQWAVSEKVGALNQHLDDPKHPHVAYRRGASGMPIPLIRGTGVRVQTVVIATQAWAMTPEQIVLDYDLSLVQVKDALAFYETHRREIDMHIAAERDLEVTHA